MYTMRGNYPLHQAAREGDLKQLNMLIQTGEHNVNKASSDLVRPLHEASLSGHLDCMQALVEAGAEVNARNIDGATPLCDACSNGKVDCVQYLLNHGAFVNPPLLMTSPLHEAVLRGHTDCMELLLKAGASLNASDCHFGTPLHVAAYKDHTHCAAMLLRYGADVNATKTHHTALHDVARHQNLSFIKLLLDHGANIHARNNQGQKGRELISSSTSPAKQLLLYWETNPHSLRHICRLCIRHVMGSSQLNFIDNFNIPKVLKEYLKFS